MYIQVYQSAPITYDFRQLSEYDDVATGFAAADIAQFPYVPNSPYRNTILEMRSVWAHEGDVFIAARISDIRTDVADYNVLHRVYRFDGSNGALLRDYRVSTTSLLGTPEVLGLNFGTMNQDRNDHLYYYNVALPGNLYSVRTNEVGYEKTGTVIPNFKPVHDPAKPSVTTAVVSLFASGWDFGEDIVIGYAVGLMRINQVGVFRYSTGELLRTVTVCGEPREVTMERHGFVNAISRIGMITRFNYTTGQVYGIGRLKKSVDAPAEFNYLYEVAYSYDRQFNRLLVAEKTPDNADGTSTVVVKGYYTVPIPSDIYQPIANRIPQTGQSVEVFSRAIGDAGETFASQQITFTGQGPAALSPSQTQTNAVGYAKTRMNSPEPGEEIVTASLIVPESV